MAVRGLPWAEVMVRAGALAESVAVRFAAHEHHVMATVRDDGRPRVSGTNLFVTDGRLWLGMMPTAARRRDLMSRPWCAVHSAPLNTALPPGEGDVRLDADVVFVDDADSRRLLASSGRGGSHADAVERDEGTNGGVDGVVVELLVRSMDLIEVDGDALSLTSWSVERGASVRRVG